MSLKVEFLSDKDLHWNFSNKQPCYIIDGGRGYEYVDPFPCYSHNRDLVLSEVNRIDSLIKLKYPPKYYILSHESKSRTNGHASSNDQWLDTNSSKTVPNPTIVLVGKRIPIMPSMTRYLISHETGHVIEYNLRAELGLKGEEFRSAYAKIRGIDYDESYGGRNWHKNTGEVIANDIRIVYFDREVEFWPHDCEHPLKCKKILDFLSELRLKYFSDQEELKLQ